MLMFEVLDDIDFIINVNNFYSDPEWQLMEKVSVWGGRRIGVGNDL